MTIKKTPRWAYVGGFVIANVWTVAFIYFLVSAWDLQHLIDLKSYFINAIIGFLISILLGTYVFRTRNRK